MNIVSVILDYIVLAFRYIISVLLENLYQSY